MSLTISELQDTDMIAGEVLEKGVQVKRTDGLPIRDQVSGATCQVYAVQADGTWKADGGPITCTIGYSADGLTADVYAAIHAGTTEGAHCAEFTFTFDGKTKKVWLKFGVHALTS